MIVDFIARLRARLVKEKESPRSEPKFPAKLHEHRAELAGFPKHASVQQLVRLTTDYNGHIRQAALERLTPTSSPDMLRVVLLRLNDWVPQVRQAARALAWTYLKKEYADVIIACLPDILMLKVRHRDDHTPFLSEAQKLLTSDEIRPKLLAGLQHMKGASARFAYQMLLDSSNDDTASVYQLAASHCDCSIRLMVTRACAVPTTAHAALLHGLTQDSHPSVRVEALRSLWEQNISDKQRNDLLAKCLLDRSAGVRDLALWYVRQSGFDLATFLEEQASSYVTAMAPLGFVGLLEQVGNKKYLLIAQRASESSAASVRLAGLVARVRLDPDCSIAVMQQGMLDPSAKIYRFALKLHSANNFSLPIESNVALIRQLLSRGYVDRALSLTGLLPTWEMLEYYLLIAQGVQREEDAQLLISAMNSWLFIKRLSFVRLVEAQRNGVENQVALARQSRFASLWPLDKIAESIANTPR